MGSGADAASSHDTSLAARVCPQQMQQRRSLSIRTVSERPARQPLPADPRQATTAKLSSSRRTRQTPVRPAWIVLDFLEHMSHQLSPQFSLGQLLLQARERQSNHVGGSDGNPVKLRLCSNSPDPFVLLSGQRCGDLVVGLRPARHHAGSLTMWTSRWKADA